jgi:protein ImuB
MSVLPVPALRVAPKLAAALAEVNVTRVGQLLSLPREALLKRFGPELTTRIDQALGDAWEAVEPAAEVTAQCVELVLGGPVKDAHAIQLGVRSLLGRLLDKLRPLDQGLMELEVELTRSDCGPLRLTQRLTHPSQDERHLWSLLRPAVEKANLGFGVEGIRLTARRVGRLAHAQMSLLPELDSATPRRLGRQLGELTDTLLASLGRQGVTKVRMVQSHLPEQSLLRVSVMEIAPRTAKKRNHKGHKGHKERKSSIVNRQSLNRQSPQMTLPR